MVVESASSPVMARPVGPNQERYLLAETLTAPAYMMPLTNRIRGPLDHGRLQAAIETVCNRHESLRCRIEPLPGMTFQAVPEPYVATTLDMVDLPVDAPPEQVAATIRTYVMRKPDLSAPSLRLFQLIRFADDHHLLTVSHHHSVSDGQSTQIFLKEVFDAYRGAPAPGDAPPYSAFYSPDWTETDAYRSAQAYWIERLSDVGEATAIARDRQGGEDEPLSDSVDHVLPYDVARAVRATAKDIGVSTFNILYAVAGILLARQSGSRHVVTAFQSNGRRSLKGSERTIGPFSNALVVALDVDPAQRFSDFVRGLRVDVTAAIKNEAVPFHHIIRLTGVRPHYGINAYPALARFDGGDLDVTPAEMPIRESDFDINFRFFDEPDRLSFYIYYASRVLRRDRIALIAEMFGTVLAEFAARPDALIGEIRVSDPAANAPLPEPIAAVSDKITPIHSRFLDAARRHPDKIAIETPSEAISYGELEARSAVLANRLSKLPAAASPSIGIVAPRSIALIVAMVAASRAGRAFAVLDPGYPDPRLRQAMALAGVTTVLTAASCRDRASMLAGIAGHAATQVIPIECDASADRGDSPFVDTAPAPILTGEPIAYYLFTSGSTGTPKCIATGHAPLGNFVDWQSRTFDIGADDRVTMLSGLSHDPVMRDVFTTLSVGATLLIPEGVPLAEPGALGDWMLAVRPTVAHMTPALGRIVAISHGSRQPIESLRWIFWGGDILAPSLLKQIAPIVPGARSVNFYGATETPQAVASQIWDGDETTRTVPIGQAVDGFALTVEDPAGGVLARGEVGELVISSHFLSMGYVDGGALVAHPCDGQGTPRYRTGDRAYRLPDGAIQLLGRTDDQIKVRGFRVEPGEVAAALGRLDGVKAAVVLPRESPAGRSMVAFVELADGIADAPAVIRSLQSSLRQTLQDYMVPDDIRRVDAIPLLPNGKVDRAALLAMIDAPTAPDARVSERSVPANALESELVTLWQSILGMRGIKPTSSFAAIGGDSLSFVEISIATEKKLGSLPDRWETMSIAELAKSQQKTLPRPLAMIETAMLVRAVAIILVVSGHFKAISYGGGATHALFLVTGFLIGNLQLTEVFRTESARPFFGLILKILVPVWLYSFLLFSARMIFAEPANISMILLVENFVDYSQYSGPYRDGHDFFLWYVHCFLQIIALIAVGAWLNFRVGMPIKTPLAMCIGLLAIGAIGRFGLPFMFVDDFATLGVTALSMPNYLPSAHLGTVALGALVATVTSTAHKGLVTAIILLFAALSAWFYPSNGWSFIIAFGIALLFFKRLIFLKFLIVPVLTLSGASLFIYLTHFQWRSIMRAIGLPEIPTLQVALAIVGGIIIWMMWQRLTAYLTFRRNDGLGDPALVDGH